MGRGSRSAIPITIGVAAIMLVVGVALGSIAFPVTKTETSKQLTTVTATQTLVSMVGQTVTRNVTVTTLPDILPITIPCYPNYPNGTAPPDVPVIFARQNSDVTVCVKYYYYNSTSSETFNTTSLLDVRGTSGVEIPPYPFNLNITINAYPSQLTLGGSSNLDEGEIVLYVISTGVTSNGTYILNLSTLLYPSLQACGGFTKFIISNPNPIYAFFGSCTPSLSNFYPLNPYGFVNGFLTAKVVGISNST